MAKLRRSWYYFVIAHRVSYSQGLCIGKESKTTHIFEPQALWEIIKKDIDGIDKMTVSAPGEVQLPLFQGARHDSLILCFLR